jgi:acetyl esterase/lipase
MHALGRRSVRRAVGPVVAPVVALLTIGVLQASAQSPRESFPVWPGQPPGETASLPPEADTSTADSDKVAGRSVIRLGNVSTPTLTVYPAPVGIATGAAVVVCPGGGHRILAMDLEGSEVAAWLNAQGVTAFVLKYRVPARDPGPRWRAAVDDAQRAMSVVRSRATSFGVDPSRIGMLGFSAGGETAGLTALLPERQYTPVDAVDQVPYRPDFVILAYAAGMATQDGTALRDYVRVTKDTDQYRPD